MFQRTLVPPPSNFTLKTEAAGPPKCWYPTTSLHNVTTQNTTWIFNAMETSNLAFLYGFMVENRMNR
jgi:hypothetical protein